MYDISHTMLKYYHQLIRFAHKHKRSVTTFERYKLLRVLGQQFARVNDNVYAETNSQRTNTEVSSTSVIRRVTAPYYKGDLSNHMTNYRAYGRVTVIAFICLGPPKRHYTTGIRTHAQLLPAIYHNQPTFKIQTARKHLFLFQCAGNTEALLRRSVRVRRAGLPGRRRWWGGRRRGAAGRALTAARGAAPTRTGRSPSRSPLLPSSRFLRACRRLLPLWKRKQIYQLAIRQYEQL